MFVDSILFILIIGLLQYVKLRYPNFLFFCKGAVLFIPPEADQAPTINKKSKQKEKDLTVKIMKVQYNQVKDCPMKQQYERVIFVIASLVICLPLKFILKKIWSLYLGRETQWDSSLIFIICFLLLIYAIKIGIQIFWISSYNIKISIMAVLGVNLLIYGLVVALSGTSAIDETLKYALLDYQKLLRIIFGRQINDKIFNMNLVLFCILIFNALLGLVCIPAVIKFGNWYTKTLKQIYYQDEEQISDDPQVRKQKQQREKLLKIKSAGTVRQLNYYLVASLLFLVFSHRYSHQFVSEGITDLIRVVLMGLMTYFNVNTLKEAIQFNGSFAYKYIAQFFSSSDETKKQELRKRIFHYISMIWYFKFQLMFRIIIPLIFFMMLMNQKYLSNSNTTFQAAQPIIMENSCGIYTDEMNILENLYACDYNLTDVATANKVRQNSFLSANGIMIGKQMITNAQVTQQRVAKYGIFEPGLVIEILQIIQWYFGIVLYGATILYILFIRKTVYDI